MCFVLSLIPALKNPVLNTFSFPLKVLTLVEREVSGIIFYHRNFILNEKLKQQLDYLNNKLIAREEVAQENERLKKILFFKEKSPYRLVAARVIARCADNWSSMVIIDKGYHSGIKSGMTVINYSGLAGRVVEAAEFVSKIMLINDPNFNVSAIDQRSRQEGLACGNLSSHLVFRYLPKESDVKVSDLVLTSGLTELCPKGLSIGTIVEVNEDFSGLSLYCLIKPAVNLSSVEELMVIIR